MSSKPFVITTVCNRESGFEFKWLRHKVQINLIEHTVDPFEFNTEICYNALQTN